MIKQLLLLAGILLVPGTAALAHAHLVTSTPADGSTLSVPPASVSLTFSEATHVTAAFVQKDQEPKRALNAASANATTVTIPLSQLKPGSYTISWRAIGSDMHVTSGQIHFVVSAPASTSPPANR